MQTDHEQANTVDQYLNEVTYLEDSTYVPSDFALEFVNFIKLVNGTTGEENLTPLIHYQMLDQLISGETNIANMCARGTAKTTVFGEYLILYLAVYGALPSFGNINYGLYVSDSIENGIKKMRLRIERRRENSSFLTHYIPNIRFTDIRWYFKNIDGNELVITGHGAKTGVRGTVELNTRPQLAILDDLLSDDDARSPTVIASVEDTIYKAIDYALHPKKHIIIWSGTPFNARDPLYKAIESGAWAVNVYPICAKFPCTKDEFISAWPDRFDYAYVLSKYEKAKKLGRVDTFNQEMMLRIMSDDDRLVNDAHIKWYSRRLLLQNKRAFNIYITTDFATSERQSADYSVISVWALNAQGYWFWVDGICKRQLMDKNIDHLFRLTQMYRPLSVGIEVSGQQGGFIPWLQKEMMSRNCFFNIASSNNSSQPGIRPTTNKMVRFMVVAPWFSQGLMHFPQELKESPIMNEFMEEFRLIAPSGFRSKHDDCIDTVSMLPLLETFRPSPAVVFEESDSGIWSPRDEEDDMGSALNSYVV